MGDARSLEHSAQVLVELQHGRVVGLAGRNEVDRNAGHPTVGRRHPPHNFDRVERDVLDSLQPGVAQGGGVLNEGAHDQVVVNAFAVRKVGQRIDPAGVRRLPGFLGERLDGAENLAGEDRAVLRRDADQRGIGRGVGVLQGVIGGQLRIVFSEQNAMVIGNGDVLAARHHPEHDERCGCEHQPAKAQQRGRVAMQEPARHRPAPADRCPPTVLRHRANNEASLTRASASTYGSGRAFRSSCLPDHIAKRPRVEESPQDGMIFRL